MTFGLSAAAIGGIAAVGGAAIGAVASNSASKRAAKGAKRGQDILSASREQARSDVNRIFPQAQEMQSQGFDDFRNFLTNQVVPQQTQPFVGGNMAAQAQVARGLPQIQNAILGRQTDLSGFKARQVGQQPSFDLGAINPQPTEATPASAQFNLDEFLKNLNVDIGGETPGSFGATGAIGGGPGRSLTDLQQRRSY